MTQNYIKHILSFLAFGITVSAQSTWRDAYNRGNPTLVSYCANPTYIKEADGMCYPPCPGTHPTSYGTATCYGLCWYLYVDTGGPTCNPNGDYGRGIGKSIFEPWPYCSGSPNYFPALGCEEVSAGLWYPVC
jgi:hypothetical protein